MQRYAAFREYVTVSEFSLLTRSEEITYQSTEEIVIVSSAELHVTYVHNEGFFGQLCGGVQHDMFVAPAVKPFDGTEEINHVCGVCHPLHIRYAEGCISRLKALV